MKLISSNLLKRSEFKTRIITTAAFVGLFGGLFHYRNPNFFGKQKQDDHMFETKPLRKFEEKVDSFVYDTKEEQDRKNTK